MTITTQASTTFSGTTDVFVDGERVGFFEADRYGYLSGWALIGAERFQRSVGKAKTYEEIIRKIVAAVV